MKITLRKINEVDIDLEKLAREVITDILYYVDVEWHKPSLEQITEREFANCCYCYSKLDNLTSYDNYYETIQVITKNMIQWCAENNTQFYDTMIEYDKRVGEELGI